MSISLKEASVDPAEEHARTEDWKGSETQVTRGLGHGNANVMQRFEVVDDDASPGEQPLEEIQYARTGDGSYERMRVFGRDLHFDIVRKAGSWSEGPGWDHPSYAMQLSALQGQRALLVGFMPQLPPEAATMLRDVLAMQ